MKCNASKASEGNLSKSLPCNDECARLERNRKLALALNIDQSSHVNGGDHIPFSAETLSLFQENFKWGQDQEREFRVFAAADDEKRMRFKPMKAQERAFLHHLAEDFGFDSESVDPEPHRHVIIFKSPRFVSAPGKTLAECVRIRASQRAAAGKMAVAEAESTKNARANEVGEPYNAYLITRPRFGLTIEEVRSELMAVVPSTLPIQFDVEFLPNEEVILKGMTRTLDERALEQMIKDYKGPLANAIAGKALGSVQLCHTDSSLNVTRRESDSGPSDGWSRVAAKGAGPRRLVPQSTLAGRNAFAALNGDGGKVTFSAKKKEKKPVKIEEPVADDWEAAEIAEEEKEKYASGVSSAGEEEGDGVAEETGKADDSALATESGEVTAPQADAVEEKEAASEVASEVVTA